MPSNPIERYAGRSLFVIPLGFAVSLLFLLFGPYVNFGTAGFIDPWIYTGYFTNFSYIQRFHANTYYFSRLPWTLPGILFFQIATPEVASILLNVCLVAVSVISLYYAIRWHYGTAPALITSLALLTSPFLISAVAWDYPDGPAIAYGFVAAAFAVRPGGRRWVNTVSMAVFLALSGFTNMSGAPMILSILVFPFWRQRHSVTELAREAAFILAGVAAATLALLPVSKAMLGYWPFFMKQIELASYEMGTPGLLTHMWGSGNEFLLTAYRLFPPAFLLLFGLAVLFLAKKRTAVAWPAWFALLVCCLLYCVQEFGLHGIALRVPYHSVYMVVPIFVFAGTVLGELWQPEFKTREWIPFAVVALFVVAMPFVADSWRVDQQTSQLWGNMSVAGAAAFLLLVGWRSAPSIFRIPIALLIASLLYAGPARQLNYLASIQPNNRSDFDALMSLQSVLKSAQPADREVLFWVDKDEFHANLFLSAQALWTAGAADFAGFLTSVSREELRNRLENSPTPGSPYGPSGENCRSPEAAGFARRALRKPPPVADPRRPVPVLRSRRRPHGCLLHPLGAPERSGALPSRFLNARSVQ